MSRILWGGTLYGQEMPERDPEPRAQIEAPIYEYRCDFCAFRIDYVPIDGEVPAAVIGKIEAHMQKHAKMRARVMPQLPPPPPAQPKLLVKGKDGVYKPGD